MATLDPYEKAKVKVNDLKSQPIESENQNFWYQRGERLADLGCYEEALVNFEKAIAQTPQYCAAWVFRGVMQIHLKQYEEALNSCNKALEIQPDDREAWTFRGAALYYLDRYQEAYDSYDRATGNQPRSRWRKLWHSLTGWKQTNSLPT